MLGRWQPSGRCSAIGAGRLGCEAQSERKVWAGSDAAITLAVWGGRIYAVARGSLAPTGCQHTWCDYRRLCAPTTAACTASAWTPHAVCSIPRPVYPARDGLDSKELTYI